MTTLKQPIDWRKLSLINANKIIRDNNIEELQGLLEMVTFADVDGIDDIGGWARILKLFRTFCLGFYAVKSQNSR